MTFKTIILLLYEPKQTTKITRAKIHESGKYLYLSVYSDIEIYGLWTVNETHIFSHTEEP